MSPLAPPPADLDGFPDLLLAPDRSLYRIHRRDREPWWFSSDGTGRFDLAPPAGTCYLALEPLGAFVDVFRYTAVVAKADLAARRVSTLHPPCAIWIADCTQRRARAFGVTAAIHATEEYGATRAWAAAFARAGYDGVRYRLSHDPSQRSIGIALFGTAGAAGWPVAATREFAGDIVRSARRRFGILVVPTP